MEAFIRKCNAVISLAIIVLLLVHAITGAFKMMGFISGAGGVSRVLTWIMAGLVCVHALIGIKLTWDTIRSGRMSGVTYAGENKVFWARRVSGFAIMVFVIYHVMIFAGKGGETFRLNAFGNPQLVGSILLVASVLVHILTNIRPLMIALGAGRLRKLLLDILFAMAIVLLFCAAAFVVYYLRWNVWWQVR